LNEGLLRRRAHQIGKDSKTGGASPYVIVSRKVIRFSGVGHFGFEEVIEAFLNAGGDGV
jgi:hypothetical protein